MARKEKLVVGEIYHIFTKSIAGFKIFNNEIEYSRAKNMLRYFQIQNMPIRFSRFMELEKVEEEGFNKYFVSFIQDKEKLVQIIAYCFMPTHLHLILKQLKGKGISIFMSNILNSYTRYFNTKHKRKGPLWETRFKNVLVDSDEQLLHLTRYLHLNPLSAYLVDKPENWSASSYQEYILNSDKKDRVCEFDDILNIEPYSYRDFVEDRASYQRELAHIKQLLLDGEI